MLFCTLLIKVVDFFKFFTSNCLTKRVVKKNIFIVVVVVTVVNVVQF